MQERRWLPSHILPRFRPFKSARRCAGAFTLHLLGGALVLCFARLQEEGHGIPAGGGASGGPAAAGSRRRRTAATRCACGQDLQPGLQRAIGTAGQRHAGRAGAAPGRRRARGGERSPGLHLVDQLLQRPAPACRGDQVRTRPGSAAQAAARDQRCTWSTSCSRRSAITRPALSGPAAAGSANYPTGKTNRGLGDCTEYVLNSLILIK